MSNKNAISLKREIKKHVKVFIGLLTITRKVKLLLFKKLKDTVLLLYLLTYHCSL